MSTSDTIKEMLDILDLNLTFYEKFFSKEQIKGEICQVYSGMLTYKPEKCLHCQKENEESIIKWGKKQGMILLNDVSEYKTYLRLDKQRFKCKGCGKTFLAETSLTERCCSISNRVKLSIAEKLKEPFSMSSIARMKHVSVSTVLRVLQSFFETKLPKTLPTVLCFDEFKSVKSVPGAMSFIMMDGETNQLVDIRPNRQLPHLKAYFARYSLEAREKVRYIVSDFYSPYFTLQKELFPHAQMIIDRFHISQHIGRAFLKHRIQFMKQLNKRKYQENQRYKQLKKYWKLLQKNEWDLKSSKRYWRPHFRDHLTEQEIVDRLLSDSPELKQGYELYQAFLSALHWKNEERFCYLLTEDYSDFPESYQTVIQTFRKYEQEILLALKLPYSNGPLECLNNHIKVLKRIAYGFRNYDHFKLRIFLFRGKYFWKKKTSSQAARAA